MLQNTSLPHYKGFVKVKKNPFHCRRLDALCDWFIFVFYVGTFPSARDLSLGKSLRVKGMIGSPSWSRGNLFSSHEIYAEFTVEYTATKESRDNFIDRKVCPIFLYCILEGKWISAPACNCQKHDRQSVSIFHAFSPLSRSPEVVCSINFS